MTPDAVAIFLIVIAVTLLGLGIFIVAGLGWALVWCSVPLFALAMFILRGAHGG